MKAERALDKRLTAQQSTCIIDNYNGAVNVTVYYSAILLRPFRNEVLDTIVTTADEVRNVA